MVPAGHGLFPGGSQEWVSPAVSALESLRLVFTGHFLQMVME